MYLATQSPQNHCHVARKSADIKNPAVCPVCTLLERLRESPIVVVKVFLPFGIIQEWNQPPQDIARRLPCLPVSHDCSLRASTMMSMARFGSRSPVTASTGILRSSTKYCGMNGTQLPVWRKTRNPLVESWRFSTRGVYART